MLMTVYNKPVKRFQMNQNDIQHKVHKQEGTIAVKSQYTCLCTLLTSVLQFFVSFVGLFVSLHPFDFFLLPYFI